MKVNGVDATITFGTLGYCLEFANTVNCSKPSVGYELDINSLVGDKLSNFQIPQVAVKWITYALVLHIVGLALAAGSAVFGLLAHVREMSMTCCSTCVSGFAAAVTLLAFIFDIALFFIAKARINAVGSASIGNAIWLTLAAWLLLFVSGCFYTLGRCCISNRRGSDWKSRKDAENAPSASHSAYAEEMRLDAIKAEADRKALALQRKEGGLPAFSETQPLTARIEGDHVYIDSYQDHSAPSTPASAAAYGGKPVKGGYAGGGYVQAPPGSRAVDEYYNPTTTSYPPPPQRQASGHTLGASNYAPSVYSQHQNTSPPPPTNQYLNVQGYSDRYGNNASPAQYGHTAGGTTYHSAVSHQQYPSSYSQFDPYEQQPHPQYSDPYYSSSNQSGTPSPGQGYGSNATSYYSAATPGQSQPERTYTLGGNGYGMNTIPPLPEHESGPPAPINTSIPSTSGEQRTSPVKGPRPNSTLHDDAPPGYEPGTSNIQGAWGKH